MKLNTSFLHDTYLDIYPNYEKSDNKLFKLKIPPPQSLNSRPECNDFLHSIHAYFFVTRSSYKF